MMFLDLSIIKVIIDKTDKMSDKVIWLKKNAPKEHFDFQEEYSSLNNGLL